MNKKHFWAFLTLIALVCMGSMLVSCGGDDDNGSAEAPADQTNNTTSSTQIIVSPTAELLGTVNSTTTVTVSVPSNSMWTITGVPEWLSLNKSGVGSSAVLITATQENFSDVEREATLVFTLSDGSASATCKVSQRGVLAANCRVSLGETVVMADGFAADLIFDSDCKGYREAFFLATDIPYLTDRDIFNELMERPEYSGRFDYTESPVLDPGQEIVYCVAAYGSETNPDGTHKYGPMTIKRITLPTIDNSVNMYMILSYTTSLWTITTKMYGPYGQNCGGYYWVAWEGENAQVTLNEWRKHSDAYFVYAYLNNIIEKEKETCYHGGPQTWSLVRSKDAIFLLTWGINRNTGEMSSTLQPLYKDLSSSSAQTMTLTKAKDVDNNIDVAKSYKDKCELLKDYQIIRTPEPVSVK